MKMKTFLVVLFVSTSISYADDWQKRNKDDFTIDNPRVVEERSEPESEPAPLVEEKKIEETKTEVKKNEEKKPEPKKEEKKSDKKLDKTDKSEKTDKDKKDVKVDKKKTEAKKKKMG